MALSQIIGALSILIGADTTDLDKAEGRVLAFSRSMRRIGGLMTLSITTPLVLFGRRALEAAKDAEELQSAFSFSFGEMKDDMNQWAVAVGDALGRSTQLIQQMSFTFNQLFKAAAPNQEVAAQLSQSFTVLANDLSSFFNVAERDALQKLRAGLVGEAEPLRAFGVFLSQATLEAKALELGIEGSVDAMSEQQKILLRAAVILDQTKDAQGDLLRTQNSATNQQRRMSASLEEIGVIIGQKIIPLFTPFVAGLADVLGLFVALPPEIQASALGALAFAAALGPVTTALGLIVPGLKVMFALLAASTSRILLPAAVAFGVLAASMGSVSAAAGAVRGALTETFASIKETFAGFADGEDGIAATMDDLFAGMGDSIQSSIVTALGQIEPAATSAKESIDRLGAEGARVFEATRTPVEALNAELTKLNVLLDNSYINAQTFSRAQTMATSQVASQYGQLAGVVGQALGTLFQNSKGVAIAQALINTYQGITQALANYPPPFSYAMAAAQGALGFAQVAAIRRTNRSGGGGGTSAVGSAPSPSATSPAGGGAPAGSGQTLFVRGLSSGDLFSGDTVRDLAQKLIDFQRQGGTILLR